MKPLGTPIRNDWKHEFYQSVDFDYNLWHRVKRDTEGANPVKNRIGNGIYDQLTDELHDSIVMFSSFFSIWRNDFNHEFYNRFSLDHHGSFSSFFGNW